MHRRRRVVGRFLLLALGVGLAGAGVAWRYYTTRPAYRLKQGQEALHRGAWEEADQWAAQLDAAGYPDHAHLLRGEACLRTGHVAQAVEEFNHLQDQGDILVEAAAVYGQWFLLKLHQPLEAERFLRFVVSRRPDHVDAHRGLATLYYDQGAWVPAVLHLIQWAELDPRDGRAHRFMGLIYKDLDQYHMAIPAYEEALRRDLTAPVVEEVKEELAEALVAQSHYARALKVLECCEAERRTRVPRLQALQAECWWGLGRNSEAEQLLDRSLVDQPRCPELLRLRARIHLAVPEPQPAAALLERVLEVDPYDYASRYQLAQAYEALQRGPEAAEQRGLAQQTKDALVELTNLVKEAGDKPWDGSVRGRLAQLCQHLGKSELAERWRRAAEACPCR
jgi:tetratricopeptide (TPR) repeat protein